MRFLAPVSVLGLALVPGAASAHAGAHGDDVWLHALTQADHLGLLLVGVAVLALAWIRWQA